MNFFRVSSSERGERKHGELYFVDLPGYGYAKASHAVRESFEALAVSYLVGREPLPLCVFIVDARHEPTERDERLQAFLDHHGLPWVLAANKIDALSKNDARAHLASLEKGLGRSAAAVVPVSAETGTGIGELWGVIRELALAPSDREPAALDTRGHDGRN